MIGASGHTILFEGTKIEDTGDEELEMWDIGDDDRGRRFARVLIQLDQGNLGICQFCASIRMAQRICSTSECIFY